MKKLSLSSIGLLQALGVVIYIGLVSGLMRFLTKDFATDPGFLGTAFILMLLVFSAAVTGSLVFGYPAYLALNQKIKEALTLLAYTLLYCLGMITIILVVLFTIS